MDLVLKVVVLGRACRNSGNMKNRQPLANMFVKAPFTLNEFFKDIIADELNIKAVTFTDDVRSFTTYTFKPQLRTVGPKYGKLLGKIRTALSSVDGNATMDELKANGVNVVEVEDKTPWQEACKDIIESSTKDNAELYQQILDMAK